MSLIEDLSPESRPTKSKTDDHRQIGDLSRQIWPAHPLFRLIWATAFTEPERIALAIVSGEDPTAKTKPHDVILAALTANWKSITTIVFAHYKKHGKVVSMNGVLSSVAKSGHVAAMREAVRMGATDLNNALSDAASGGQIEAMREAVRMGATYFITALAEAAFAGSIEAMREAVSMGATAFGRALADAASGNRIEAMREAVRMGASDFDWALSRAARSGHIEAMREAVSMGATDFDRALSWANNETTKTTLQSLRNAKRAL